MYKVNDVKIVSIFSANIFQRAALSNIQAILSYKDGHKILSRSLFSQIFIQLLFFNFSTLCSLCSLKKSISPIYLGTCTSRLSCKFCILLFHFWTVFYESIWSIYVLKLFGITIFHSILSYFFTNSFVQDCTSYLHRYM